MDKSKVKLTEPQRELLARVTVSGEIPTRGVLGRTLELMAAAGVIEFRLKTTKVALAAEVAARVQSARAAMVQDPPAWRAAHADLEAAEGAEELAGNVARIEAHLGKGLPPESVYYHPKAAGWFITERGKAELPDGLRALAAEAIP